MNKPCYPCVIAPAELFGSREIAFTPEERSGFTQLLRLCADFDFKVLQLQRKPSETLAVKTAELKFVLASRQWNTGLWHAATPSLASLAELENYVLMHQVDILHSHLFAEDVTLSDLCINEPNAAS